MDAEARALARARARRQTDAVDWQRHREAAYRQCTEPADPTAILDDPPGPRPTPAAPHPTRLYLTLSNGSTVDFPVSSVTVAVKRVADATEAWGMSLDGAVQAFQTLRGAWEATFTVEWEE